MYCTPRCPTPWASSGQRSHRVWLERFGTLCRQAGRQAGRQAQAIPADVQYCTVLCSMARVIYLAQYLLLERSPGRSVPLIITRRVGIAGGGPLPLPLPASLSPARLRAPCPPAATPLHARPPMAPMPGVIALFDVDGTLTPARKVSNSAAGLPCVCVLARRGRPRTRSGSRAHVRTTDVVVNLLGMAMLLGACTWLCRTSCRRCARSCRSCARSVMQP